MAKNVKIEWDADTAPCPFKDDDFFKIWKSLLGMPKWKKKPISAIELACNRLKRFDIDFAALLVENAIMGNYQGIVFADTEQKYNNWLSQKQKQNGGNSTHREDFTNSNRLGTSDARIERAKNWG